ncbi:MAG: magnesium transporter [Alphaproteobacteria bacterium]|nr:magnesium transporter [Alphaproteobacteria bacterium]
MTNTTLHIDDDSQSKAYEGLSEKIIDHIEDALDSGDHETIKLTLGALHYSDAADLLETLGTAQRRQIVSIIADEISPDLLSEIDEEIRDQIVENIDTETLANIVKELDSDDAVDLVHSLDDKEQEEVLDQLKPKNRAIIEQGLAFEEDTAGRMMQRELVAMPHTWTVGNAIEHLQSSKNLPDDFLAIYVVDPRHRPVGTVELSNLLKTGKDTPLTQILNPDVYPIHVDMDQEDVALLFRKQDWLTAMVVDDTGRILGVITVDDVVDVIDEEAGEDMLQLSGAKEGDIFQTLTKTVKSRFLWLFFNLGAAFMVSSVVGIFEETLEKAVTLAVLMPIVASMGGNAGHQTLAVTVRALAMKELTPSNSLRIVGKELLIGIINGVLFAAITGSVAWLWFKQPGIGIVIGLAMTINLLLAGLAGIIIPLTLEKMKIDPAVSSGVFLTAITDMVGFFVFLGLASSILF